VAHNAKGKLLSQKKVKISFTDLVAFTHVTRSLSIIFHS